jgi:hypothetical protein
VFAFTLAAPKKKENPASPHEETTPRIGTVPDIMAGKWVGRQRSANHFFE